MLQLKKKIKTQKKMFMFIKNKNKINLIFFLVVLPRYYITLHFKYKFFFTNYSFICTLMSYNKLLRICINLYVCMQIVALY